MFLWCNIFIWGCIGLCSCVRAFSGVTSRGGRGGVRVAHYGGFSCSGAQALGTWGSVAVHRISCPAARGNFLDQRSNPCPLYWQVDS